MLSEADGLVVCDTDLLVIRVWWEEKFGALPEAVEFGAGFPDETQSTCCSHRISSGRRIRFERIPKIGIDCFCAMRRCCEGGVHPHEVVAGAGEARFSAALQAVSRLMPDLD